MYIYAVIIIHNGRFRFWSSMCRLSLTISSFSIFNFTSEPRANFSGVPGIPEMFWETNIGDTGCNLLLSSGGIALLLTSVKPADKKYDVG